MDRIVRWQEVEQERNDGDLEGSRLASGTTREPIQQGGIKLRLQEPIPQLQGNCSSSSFKIKTIHRLVLQRHAGISVAPTLRSRILNSISGVTDLGIRDMTSPPPYNHTQSSHHDHSLRKSRPCQDILIPVTPSVMIHIPNSASYSPRSAHRRKRNTQSIPMVEIVHHKAVRQSTIMMRFDAVRNGTLPLSALYEIFDSCDIVDDWIAELFFPLHFLIFRHIIVIQNQGLWCSDSKAVPQFVSNQLWNTFSPVPCKTTFRVIHMPCRRTKRVDSNRPVGAVGDTAFDKTPFVTWTRRDSSYTRLELLPQIARYYFGSDALTHEYPVTSSQVKFHQCAFGTHALASPLLSSPDIPKHNIIADSIYAEYGSSVRECLMLFIK
ncbi:uncharacterized protein BJ212DRAFT_1299311 [Suillus subaureus]|uniref:Uncharacterized protein n=1 Tax=Suillus subaureus TaxID=48587 RepID=A0A9P7ECK5_9AGAM|nr:uncharacterized protein BJ212DRAFT_1299311 [Suillus subaureus]KAG1817143.1 hypothetical protein BJ212DRAFT_1299311 [Suillus subaureus]